ncbi:MAG: hypothetical protein IE909_18365 [Campylobacterales bacterium]|nr:hypothetical protein [Campylobacterales bacterium]
MKHADEEKTNYPKETLDTRKRMIHEEKWGDMVLIHRSSIYPYFLLFKQSLTFAFSIDELLNIPLTFHPRYLPLTLSVYRKIILKRSV